MDASSVAFHKNWLIVCHVRDSINNKGKCFYSVICLSVKRDTNNMIHFGLCYYALPDFEWWIILCVLPFGKFIDSFKPSFVGVGRKRMVEKITKEKGLNMYECINLCTCFMYHMYIRWLRFSSQNWPICIGYWMAVESKLWNTIKYHIVLSAKAKWPSWKMFAQHNRILHIQRYNTICIHSQYCQSKIVGRPQSPLANSFIRLINSVKSYVCHANVMQLQIIEHLTCLVVWKNQCEIRFLDLACQWKSNKKSFKWM